MKKLSCSVFILLIAVGVNFAVPGEYFSVSHIHKGGDFHFPILNLPRDRRVEARINQLLQLSELRGLAGNRRQEIFNEVRFNDGGLYGGKVSLSYQIRSNNSRIFSVRVDSTTSGATMHWWTSYYNFNAQNGDRIALRDLFTETGYKKFVQFAIRKRSRIYRSEVAKKVTREDRDGFLSVIGSIEQDELDDYAIGDGSITIDGADLLGKSLCCENLNMEVRFGLRDFKLWLNEFGKTVFGVKPGSVKKFRSTELPQLFEGMANETSRFVAVLARDGRDGIHGVYAYLKYRKGIMLTGTLADGQINLTEHFLAENERNPQTGSNARWVDGGSISGVFGQNNLRGSWTDKEGKITATLSANIR